MILKIPYMVLSVFYLLFQIRTDTKRIFDMKYPLVLAFFICFRCKKLCKHLYVGSAASAFTQYFRESFYYKCVDSGEREEEQGQIFMTVPNGYEGLGVTWPFFEVYGLLKT